MPLRTSFASPLVTDLLPQPSAPDNDHHPISSAPASDRWLVRRVGRNCSTAANNSCSDREGRATTTDERTEDGNVGTRGPRVVGAFKSLEQRCEFARVCTPEYCDWHDVGLWGNSVAVWLYFRFNLSFRDVEDLLAQRGITVTYETIRRWARTFGRTYARRLRQRRGRLGDTWYLNEVFVTLNGRQQYVWRAVDEDGDALDILVQSRRNRRAAVRFFRKLLKRSFSVLIAHPAQQAAGHPVKRDDDGIVLNGWTDL